MGDTAASRALKGDYYRISSGSRGLPGCLEAGSGCMLTGPIVWLVRLVWEGKVPVTVASSKGGNGQATKG